MRPIYLDVSNMEEIVTEDSFHVDKFEENIYVVNDDISLPSESTSLKEVLDTLSKTINLEVTYFNIYRGDVFGCCLRALRRKQQNKCCSF